eukprot:GHVL01020183.1.p1 GENE.GHVL01020183.1~~GHVL01020183.1.p1  ORF type:complete len:134 (+),score=20.75 GHVL01020183.1:309-710(+)
MASKMDAIASRMDTANKSHLITQDISKAVPQLNKALNDLSVEDITRSMDQFEKLFDDLDARSDYVTNAVDSTTATTTPIDQVDSLIQQVADDHALDVSVMLSDAPVGCHGMEARNEQEATHNAMQTKVGNLRT